MIVLCQSFTGQPYMQNNYFLLSPFYTLALSCANGSQLLYCRHCLLKFLAEYRLYVKNNNMVTGVFKMQERPHSMSSMFFSVETVSSIQDGSQSPVINILLNIVLHIFCLK